MPSISELPIDKAAALVPLTLMVQKLHSDHDPDRYVSAPDPADVARFLQDWIARDTVTALIAGPVHAPYGYLIYEIEPRGASVLRRAERRAMLHHICVAPDHRKRGVARALIAHMKQQDDVQTCDTCMTSYGAFNTPSAALMRAAGFTPAVVFADMSLQQERQ